VDKTSQTEGGYSVSDAEVLWKACAERIRSRVPEATWLTAFRDLRPVAADSERLVLSVSSTLLRERFETRHRPMVQSVLEEMGPPALTVEVIVESDPDGVDTLPPVFPFEPLAEDHASFPRVASSTVTGDGRPVLHLNPLYTFGAFVTGASNRFAHAAALAVAETPARAYNPLFIYGAAGLGKTHLLHAIANYVSENYRDLLIRYVSTETFMNEYVDSIKNAPTSGFKRRYRDVDVLLVDDIQFMEGKEGLQEEFFHTFNSLHGAGRQIVISSDRPPRNIATLEDRLRSRFEWGLITDIQPPELETRLAILRKKAEQQKSAIPNEILEFIAKNIRDNIRELEGALIRIAAYASLNQESLTMALAERVLADIVVQPEPTRITAERVLARTAEIFEISVDDLLSRRRHKPLVTIRQISMYVCRELTQLSYPEIARVYGGRDHTTVMYACEKIKEQMPAKRQVYEQVTQLIQALKAS
jgi:chromosomal replication initiator protein